MDLEHCDLLREGYLDVKFPPDSPERVMHKAWRKLYVRALVLHPPKREPSLILEVGRNPQDHQPQSLKVSRDGLRLFRCRSGSRPLQTWALSSGSSLIVYLAAANEEDSQNWMQTVRDGLWPSIQNVTEKNHTVSLIDDEKTFSTGILGIYGRLVKTSDGMVSIIHPHWQGILLRWKREDVADIRLVRKTGNDVSESGVFKITLKSSKTETRTFYFYSNTATSAIEWLRTSSTNTEELSTNKKSEIELSHNQCVSSSYNTSEYATVRKVSKQEDNPKEGKADTTNSQDTDNTACEKPNTSDLLSANISGDFLDASLNFAKSTQISETETKSDDDSGDDSSNVYEHLYEVMIPKTERSPTVYEDVRDSESDYVPPLPPPLPIEKPKILRLLKLSESVADALKAAEEQPLPVVDDKKSKLYRESSLKKTAPKIIEKNTVHRSSSDPNIC